MLKNALILIAVAGIIFFGYGLSTFLSNQQLQEKAPKTGLMNLEKEQEKALELKFAELSNSKTNACSGPGFIDSMQGNERLQGACCSAMDLHRYEEQVNGLKKYSEIEIIPKDPYDIGVSLAKELILFQSIQLTEVQQKIYDEAMQLSHEGGPCCCKCWRWNAFEGMAKKLITEYDFSSQQIAELWDLEDGCGGTGHAMHA